MEQTKNEPKNENKAAPDNVTAKPKKERKPLTEAQRLKRQKMIVLPAMVLVFIGAMWLIFAPSSGKEQEPGTGGYNIEMPDADKENRQIIGDKAKAYEQGRWRNGRRTAAAPCSSWATCSTAKRRQRMGQRFRPCQSRRNRKRRQTRTEDHPILGSRLPRPQCHARQLLRAAEKRQCGDGRTAGTHRHARIRTGKRKREKLHDGRAGGTHGKILRAGGEVHGRSERHAGGSGTDRRAVPCRKPERTRQNPSGR